VFLALLVALSAAAAAFAAPGGSPAGDSTAAGDPGLAQFGAIGKNGFPTWYKDKKGVRLEPCLDAADPLCIMGAVPDPNAPVTPDTVAGTTPDGTPANFPDEFFYQAASAGIDNVGANVGTAAAPRFGKALAVTSLEGAFANGAPADGDEMVFARLRLRVTAGLKPDTNYLFVHPYGERALKTDPGDGSLFVTEDIGTIAGKFDDALKGRIGPFLKWAPNPNDPADKPPAGYIGDPNVDHAITGGRNDYFAIIGPGVGANRLADGSEDCPSGVLDKANAVNGVTIDGSGVGGSLTADDCIYQPLFSLMGKIARNAGVDVKSATYSRDSSGTTIDVRADSDAGQNIVARDPNGTSATAPRFPSTKMVEKDDADTGNGHYFAQLKAANTFPAASGPDPIEIVNSTDAAPQATKEVPVVDEILGATATYTATADGSGNLVVTGHSSDTTGATLSIDDENGNQVNVDPDPSVGTGNVAFTHVPTSVLITSSQGGKLTVPVHVVGDATAAPLKADAGQDFTAKGATVKLLGTGSTGNITKYTWTGPYPVDAAGNVDTTTPADEVGDGTVTPTVTVPTTAGTYGYQLEVSGPDGSSKDTVVVTVGAAAGGPPAGELITPGKTRFQASAQRLVIDGTTELPPKAGDKIELWFDRTIKPGTKPDAVVNVDPVNGSWAYDTGRGGMPEIPACSCVSYISINGRPDSTDIGGDAEAAAGQAHEVWNNLTIENTALRGGGGGGGGAAPAVVAAATPAAAIPLVGAARPAVTIAAARLAAPATTTVATFATTGVPVTVSVPAGATLLRLRVLTTANKALLTTFKKVKGGTKVKVRIRSAKLRKQLRAGKRYVIEVRAGTAKNRLGKATRRAIRVRV
jgi:hypothetical protein